MRKLLNMFDTVSCLNLLDPHQLYNILDDLNCCVDFVFCSNTDNIEEGTGPQGARIGDLQSKGLTHKFAQAGNHWKLWSAERYKDQIKKWCTDKVKKVNPKVKYSIAFNDELQFDVQTYLLSQRRPLPSTIRVVKGSFSDVITDEVYHVIKPATESNGSIGDVVLLDNLKKGYRCGQHIVPVGPAEEEYLQSKSSKGLKIVGRVPHLTYPQCIFKGVGEVVFPLDSASSFRALASLCIALIKRDEVLIAESVFRDGIHPIMCSLTPISFADSIQPLDIENEESLSRCALLLRYIPWNEELRVGIPVKMPGMKQASERRPHQTPTEAQTECMAAYLKQLPSVVASDLSANLDNPVATRFGEVLMETLSDESLLTNSISLLQSKLLLSSDLPIPVISPTTSPTSVKVEVAIKSEFPIVIPLTMKEKKDAIEATLLQEDAIQRNRVDLGSIKLETSAGIKAEPTSQQVTISETAVSEPTTELAEAAKKLADIDNDNDDDDDEPYDFNVDFDDIF
eukprot:GHVH01008987.1.p1 GENE.GHVH01008987.1~~GHVH01008987.1.p1  ORF type:complete len:511 (-),score=93.03 GHVH01008987.1:177-1709(-)